MFKPSKLIAVIPLLAALPVLTGCINIEIPFSSPEPVVTDTPQPTEEQSPSVDITDLTAPGTVLSMGKSALVLFFHGKDLFSDEVVTQRIQVSVTGFRTGSAKDFDGYKDNGYTDFDSTKKRTADSTLYYVDFTAQGLGPDIESLAFKTISWSLLIPRDQDDEDLLPIDGYLPGFTPCEEGGFDHAGALKSCLIFSASSAQQLTSVIWRADKNWQDGSGPDYYTNPIIWK
jgi:hypothetical protein